MKYMKKIFIFILILSLISCSQAKNEKENIEVEGKINEVTTEEEKDNMKNVIENKNSITMIDNTDNIINLELRNNTMVNEYIKVINIVKNFSEENSLRLTYVEPIADRISRVNAGGKNNIALLLEELYEEGAETVNYFTDEKGLNVDLSISVDNSETTYSCIVYKASIENIDSNFKFKDSKLNEFRKSLVEPDELDFNKLDEFIRDVYNNKEKRDTVFFNKIDDDKYEVIRVEGNNCYYKLVYDPKS